MRHIVCWLMILLLLPVGSAAQTNPTPGKGRCGKEYCYWETPMEFSDPETIWNVLIQPMTIVKGNQRLQEILRAAPSHEAEPVGEVTYGSQGVHVLETLDNGWSLVECYSSSNGMSQLQVYGDLVQGYLPTELLEVRETKTKYGLVVDKLNQRMYLFHEGEWVTTLRVSTGRPSVEEPQRDTNAGEFHLVSMIGDFVSEGGAICEHAMRFNDGDLIHNVPYQLDADGQKDYMRTEKNLGKKASDGCIRVQRKRTPEGINMLWLWSRLFDQKYTKLLIWEAVPGRQLPIPPADTPVYVLPEHCGTYHKSPNCYDLDPSFFPLPQITYGQLEEEAYAGLTDCVYCNPPLRVSQLEALNASVKEIGTK